MGVRGVIMERTVHRRPYASKVFGGVRRCSQVFVLVCEGWGSRPTGVEEFKVRGSRFTVGTSGWQRVFINGLRPVSLREGVCDGRTVAFNKLVKCAVLLARMQANIYRGPQRAL